MSRLGTRFAHDVATCVCRACTKAREAAWWEEHRPAEDFSAELVRLRAEGATFRQLAEAMGLSVGTIHRVVRGGTTIDPATQDVLTDFFAHRP